MGARKSITSLQSAPRWVAAHRSPRHPCRPNPIHADTTTMATDVSTILQLEVPLVVQVGTRAVSLEHVLSFGPGAILELNKSSEEPLDLLINNKSVGTGRAVKVGENFGVRISQIGSAAERVEALGASDL